MSFQLIFLNKSFLIIIIINEGKKGQILYALASEKITTTTSDTPPSKSDTRRRFGEFKKDPEALKILGSIQLPNTGGSVVAWNGTQFELIAKTPGVTGGTTATPLTEEKLKKLLDKYD